MTVVLIAIAALACMLTIAVIASLVGALWLKLAAHLLNHGPIPYGKAYQSVFLAALVSSSVQAIVAFNVIAQNRASQLMLSFGRNNMNRAPRTPTWAETAYGVYGMNVPTAYTLTAIFSLFATALIFQKLLSSKERLLSFADAATLSFTHHALSVFGGLTLALLVNLMVLRLMSI